MTLTVDRSAIEAFLEAVGNTNFEIVGYANGLEGALIMRIIKETKIFGTNIREPEVRSSISGYTGGTGASRGFDLAYAAAKSGDIVRACELLVTSYFYEVELRLLTWIDTPDPDSGMASQHPNPLAKAIEPLIWRKDVESGEVSAHGGARPGAGRPPELGESKLISLDMPVSMRDELDVKAKERGVSRAELMRTLIAEGLEKSR